jgi:hypothetical protein
MPEKAFPLFDAHRQRAANAAWIAPKSSIFLIRLGVLILIFALK